jgi:TolB-like protein/Tfp pilus assembly protein PilF
MKRCPECRRDYYDDSLMFCLDDGAALLEGPTSGQTATAILSDVRVLSEAPTKTSDTDTPTERSINVVSNRSSIAVAVVGMVMITALGIGSYLYYGRGPSKQIESIAVLPFVNTGGNPDIEYLSDGITESLINSLSQVPNLSVKARSSVFTFKGKDVSPQQVANALSVQAVLSGRVQQRGDQILLNVELVDAGSGDQIWGDNYARRMSDIIQLQSDIARDVAGKLKAKITGEEGEKIARSHTENIEANQLYLRGRYHWNKRTTNDIKKSIEFFQQAIDKDPTYALAYAALAEAYILAPSYGVGPANENYPKARAAAAKSIEIDSQLAEGHNALASVMSNYDWKFSDAEAEWKMALLLNPNYATAHQWYAEHLMFMGRHREALAEIQLAEQVDPLSLIINGMAGVALRNVGQDDAAVEQIKKTIEMDPNFPRAHLFLAETYQKLGRYEEAIDEFSKAAVMGGLSPEKAAATAAMIKKAARAGGEKAYSRAMAEAFSENSSAPTPAPILAAYWARAGEPDKAFEVLEKAYREHDDTLLMLKDEKLDPIKSDPRYKDLLRRIGLPD